MSVKGGMVVAVEDEDKWDGMSTCLSSLFGHVGWLWWWSTMLVKEINKYKLSG
jgi:hypothetical protein